MNAEPGYRILASVLNDALNQAQHGKGKERHAAGESFDKQEICQNTRAVGFGYPLGQARKKAREAKRLLRDRGKDAAIAECLGAINYLAAAVIVMEEQEQAETDEIFERAAAETWNRDDDMILGDHSERTAAQGVEDTLRFRQNKHEYLRAASKILDTPPRQPSLAGLVDWSDAPDWAVCAAQDKNGDIYFFSTNEVMLNSYHPHKYEWANITGRAAFYKTAPLAHDWQTPLKRPANHAYTDEEPEHRFRAGHKSPDPAEDIAKAEKYREFREAQEMAEDMLAETLQGDSTESRSAFGQDAGLTWGWCTRCRGYGSLDTRTLLCRDCHTFPGQS